MGLPVNGATSSPGADIRFIHQSNNNGHQGLSSNASYRHSGESRNPGRELNVASQVMTAITPILTLPHQGGRDLLRPSVVQLA